MFDFLRAPAELPGDAPSPDEDHELALYMYYGCGYSHRVMHHAEQLGIDLPLRDIHADRANLDELVRLTGRRTVPVLWVDGQPLPESRVIMAWLDRYAERSR